MKLAKYSSVTRGEALRASAALFIKSHRKFNPNLQEFEYAMYLTVDMWVRLGEGVEVAGQFIYSTSFQIRAFLFSQKAPKRYEIWS